MTNIELQTRREGLEVMLLRAGLKAGVDNCADLLLRFKAPHTLSDGTRGAVIAAWDSSDYLPSTFEEDLARMAELALRKVALSISVPRGATVVPMTALAQHYDEWGLPDMAWGQETWVAMRILVPASMVSGIDEGVRARVRVTGNHVSEPTTTRHGTTLLIPVLAADEYDETPEDVFVRDWIRRVQAG